MTPEKTKEVLRKYLELLGSHRQQMPEGLYDVRYEDVPYKLPNSAINTEVSHAAWMCERAIEFVDEGRIEKAMRWLGWVNYAMWRCNILTLNAIKRACMPDPDEEPEITWVCSNCGGTNVETVCWVDPNTDQVHEDYGTWNHQDTTWCGDCDDHHPLISKEEWDEKGTKLPNTGEVRQLVVNADGLTREDLERAPMFTIFNGRKPAAIAYAVPKMWCIDDDSQAVFSNEVEQELKRRGVAVCGLVNHDDAMRGALEKDDDESRDEQIRGGWDIPPAKRPMFDDIDGALLALNEGLTLIKCPDALDGERRENWRLYVVKRVDRHQLRAAAEGTSRSEAKNRNFAQMYGSTYAQMTSTHTDDKPGGQVHYTSDHNPDTGEAVSTTRRTLEEDICRALNLHSAENQSNTPDFILAEYLIACLTGFSAAMAKREDWYGSDVEPVECSEEQEVRSTEERDLMRAANRCIKVARHVRGQDREKLLDLAAEGIKVAQREAIEWATKSMKPPVVRGDLEVEKVLVLSSSHITKEEMTELEESIYVDSDAKGEYFVVFSVTAGENDDATLKSFCGENAYKLVLFARENGCTHLKLDRDGDVVEGFPTFDW